jgi:hypothetical protein
MCLTSWSSLTDTSTVSDLTLEEARRLLNDDDNVWLDWSNNDHQNLFDEACQEIDHLRSRMTALNKRIWPEHGQGFQNEVERQRGIIGTLQDIAHNRESEAVHLRDSVTQMENWLAEADEKRREVEQELAQLAAYRCSSCDAG